MALMAATGTVALFWTIWPEGWKGETPAAWVQAIGSVIGIVIAITVPAWQHQKAEMRRQEESRAEGWRVLRLASMLVRMAETRAQNIGATRSKENFPETPKMRARQLASLQEVLEGLNAIPLTAIPTSEAIEFVMKVRRLLVDAIDEVQKFPYPTADMTCSSEYGRPWIRFYNEFREAAQLLSFHASQFHDGTREPRYLDDMYGP